MPALAGFYLMALLLLHFVYGMIWLYILFNDYIIDAYGKYTIVFKTHSLMTINGNLKIFKIEYFCIFSYIALL